MKYVLQSLLILCMLLVNLSSASQCDPLSSQHPFVPGEKLTFTLKWGKIPAGEAVLEVLPIESLDGEPVYHFVMTARTNSFVDVFYKVRDRIDGYASLDMTRSVLYKTKQHEGNHKRDIVVTFDWETQQAQYTDRGKTRDPITIAEGSFDPLSALYYTRLADIRLNEDITRPVTDGRKNTIGVVKVLKRETLEVSDVIYDTFLVEPDTKDLGGVFKKSDDAKIHLWLTADEHRIPVKIKSKVAVGSFVGELVDKTGLRLLVTQTEEPCVPLAGMALCPERAAE
ncbi:MAG: DUF3108 domain-containing protein [Candidatus Vecturithrix sp.]|nr:DUF3108 domain-containing protein [Candidatus Vecturithrix sp.]